MDKDHREKKKAGENPDRNVELVEVCRVWGPSEAEVVKSFLESHGIPCLIRGHIVPFVYPFTVDGLAEFKILVPENDLAAAKELMASRPAPDENGGPEEPD
jgi:hypothetical protein